MASLNYDHLFEACRELFGPEIDTCAEFLHYLQPKGVKSAFRRKAKETHPDCSAKKAPHLQDMQAAHFCRAKSAYETLTAFLSQREQEMPLRATRQSSAQKRPRPQASKSGLVKDVLQSVPQRVLPLGRYLYYRKVISFSELLQALSCQRASRGSLGVIAREWGWMTASEVFAVMSAKLPGKFGEKAIRLGILNPSRVKIILLEQKIRHQRLGQYFLQSKILTPQELELFLKEHRLHNSRFGTF